jgi:predicted nuclease of predicted toxin-antitoxin system
MKILVDMNLSPGWVEFLVDEGFDAVHWSSVGAGSALDGEVMDGAREHGFTLLTADLDFGAILAASQHRRPSGE